MNEVRIIPFVGTPLEYEEGETPRTQYAGPERGFLIGPENYALEPVVRWVVEDETDRSPVLLYGPYGSGRSHLLQGIFQAWRANQASDPVRRRSVSLSAADFARSYADAVTTKTTDDFRRRYREATLLLMDDIDHLNDKPWIQEELRHILDAVSMNGGIVVMTSAEIPTGISNFTESLLSRVLGGTPIPVFLPGPAVRRHFLQDLCPALRISLTEKTLNLVAEELALSIPALYGFFARLRFMADMENAKIDSAYVKRFMKDHDEESRPGIETIAKKTANHFSLKVADLKGKSRNKSISLARSVAVYLARHQGGANLKDIAKFFGNRDPSTIRHLIEKIHKMLSDDTELRDHLFRLGLR